VSNATNEAAITPAPRSGKVIQLAITTTVTAFAIPPSFQGCQCTWSVYASDLTTPVAADVAFGTQAQAQAVVYGDASGVTSQEITIKATTGGRVFSGSGSKSWVMPVIESGVVTHFGVDGSASLTLEIVKG